jgi:hypothetical protein
VGYDGGTRGLYRRLSDFAGWYQRTLPSARARSNTGHVEAQTPNGKTQNPNPIRKWEKETREKRETKRERTRQPRPLVRRLASPCHFDRAEGGCLGRLVEGETLDARKMTLAPIKKKNLASERAKSEKSFKIETKAKPSTPEKKLGKVTSPPFLLCAQATALIRREWSHPKRETLSDPLQVYDYDDGFGYR